MKVVRSRLTRLVLAFFIVLALFGVSWGATGVLEKSLQSSVNEELRGLRLSLAQSIRDPAELERVLAIKKEELESFYGLEDPWYVRSFSKTASVLRGDFGEAKNIRTTEGSSKVSDIIVERVKRTIILTLPAFAIVMALGILIGLWLVTRPDGKIDKIFSIFSAISAALPPWLLAIPLIMILAVTLKILPTGGMYSTPPPQDGLLSFLDLLWHAILPIASMVLVSLGPYLYEIRSMTLKVAQEDYVLCAKAMGFSPLRIRMRYILRPAAPVIATGLLLALAGSFSGAIITEMMFNWPGMGTLYREAFLGTPDEGLIVALTVMFMFLYAAATFILEILYLFLDPRIRY